ncbi:hypothetical protein cyc_02313 [Cyclospora cayetanensis]|uniref:Uncharacterized protein n=1 Tax=Cyclospora cayetanensis TaxID=88456 RepID=A0A1D3D5I2_9EIME|nr:hypothetical protein cyc_02313 [Cyclospora cayetanensis]
MDAVCPPARFLIDTFSLPPVQPSHSFQHTPLLALCNGEGNSTNPTGCASLWTPDGGVSGKSVTIQIAEASDPLPSLFRLPSAAGAQKLLMTQQLRQMCLQQVALRLALAKTTAQQQPLLLHAASCCALSKKPHRRHAQ